MAVVQKIEPEAARHADALAADLRRRIRGEVRFDDGARALYASDLSMYRQVPIGVVIPRDAADVIAAAAVCRDHGVPILGRGCGTSLAGQCCNVAVVIDFSKYMHRILELDPDGRTAWVEPGVICDQLRDAAEKHHLTFAPDPATHEYCTLGGMIGNNSCGVHTVMGGKTVDNVEELEILTYDGTRMRVGATPDAELERIIHEGGRRGHIYARLRALRDRYADLVRKRYPRIPRRVSGYNLDELLPERGFHVARALVGSESTLALVLRARVRLVPSPPHRALLVIGYPSLPSAGDHAAEIRGLGPIGLEAFHEHVMQNMERQGKKAQLGGRRLLPPGTTWLLVEFGGETADEARARARDAMAVQGRRDRDQLGMTVVDDTAEQKAVWHIRESGVGASRIPGVEDAWPSWEDAAVPPERLGEYLREITRLLDEYGYAYTTYGHFGDGCVHMRITFDVRTPQGVRRFRTFMERAADIVLSHGGSLSGEHGDGQARAELLPKMFGPELIEAFREYKAIWDPAGKMNPGKLVDPYPLDSNLRTGPEYHRRPVMTHFRFPEDHGSMAEATERCFGVGKCRHLEGGTMCPSFMVTRDEMHTTRGRARLLFEMLRGEAITDGWKSEPVKEALDLCFACKGCKGDCPVSVDIATYKAEFLSHYYEGRLRPAAAYAMGLIFQWARLAARAPALVNFVTQTPFLAGLAKRAAGLAPERDLPPFARETFQAWWVRRRWNQHGGPVAAPGGAVSTVVLWPDTFTNYFHPEIGRAAVDVLERAGHRVVVPPQPLCCGRPLYDYGMLDRAKVQLRQILETLRPYIRAGVPFVGLEPSCVAVFRDELGNLFPDDEDARRLSRQTFWLSEFLTNGGDADLKRLPKMSGRAVLHVHCHQKALHHGAQGGDAALLRALGLEVDVLDSGCCGVAGSFGYERDHYEVSIKAGERVLLPAVRGAAPDTLIVADGFSCRNQIEHATRRRALHLAEVVQLAYEEEARGGKRLPVFAEQRFPNEPAALPLRQLAAAAAAVGLGAIALRAAADACRRRSASPASSTRAADAKRAEGGHVALRR